MTILNITETGLVQYLNNSDIPLSPSLFDITAIISPFFFQIYLLLPLGALVLLDIFSERYHKKHTYTLTEVWNLGAIALAFAVYIHFFPVDYIQVFLSIVFGIVFTILLDISSIKLGKLDIKIMAIVLPYILVVVSLVGAFEFLTFFFMGIVLMGALNKYYSKHNSFGKKTFEHFFKFHYNNNVSEQNGEIKITIVFLLAYKLMLITVFLTPNFI